MLIQDKLAYAKTHQIIWDNVSNSIHRLTTRITPETCFEFIRIFNSACTDTALNYICKRVYEDVMDIKVNENGKREIISDWRKKACEQYCPTFSTCTVSGNSAHSKTIGFFDYLKSVDVNNLTHFQRTRIRELALKFSNDPNVKKRLGLSVVDYMNNYLFKRM